MPSVLGRSKASLDQHPVAELRLSDLLVDSVIYSVAIRSSHQASSLVPLPCLRATEYYKIDYCVYDLLGDRVRSFPEEGCEIKSEN